MENGDTFKNCKKKRRRMHFTTDFTCQMDCNSTTVENHRFQNVKTLPFILVLGPPPLSVFCHFEIRLCCTFEKNLRIASPKLCTSASKLFTSSVQQKFSRRFHIDIFEITVDFKSQIGKRTKEAVKQKVAKIATNARK